MVTSLPERYGEDYIGVLVRDPYHIFIYWELTENMRKRVLHNWGLGEDTPCRLRIEREDGGRWETVYVAELPPGAESWYVNGVTPGEVYRAQIGLNASEGQFVVILASAAIHLPPAGPAKRLPGRALAISGGIRPVALEDMAEQQADGQDREDGHEQEGAPFSSFSLYRGDNERGQSSVR
ncbi:DUF4912 domain-containing protein [Heliomicrobium modesticaldum]|nr:DUF4912 domain-containing protein [Heliomicrobium modesticaldum]